MLRALTGLLLVSLSSVFARDTACSLSSDDLYRWLVDSAKRSFGPSNDDGLGALQNHAANLRSQGVDGEVLCHAPAAWVAAMLKHTSDEPGFTPSFASAAKEVAVVSSTHVCKQEAIQRVADATFLWERGSPSEALDYLSSAVDIDGECCAPYREFSRFFLGGNSPFMQLPTQALKDETRRKAIDLWEGKTQKDAAAATTTSSSSPHGSQWRQLAGYAAAHASHYNGRDHDHQAQAKATSVFADLVKGRTSTLDGDGGGRGDSFRGDGGEGDGGGSDEEAPALFVATVASEERVELGHLRHSAHLAGLELHVLGLGQRYEGHETKLRLYDEFLTSKKQSSRQKPEEENEFVIKADDVVMLVDAYDVLLSPSAADVALRFKTLFPDKPLVFAAERTLWPDAALEAVYPKPPPPPSSSSSLDTADGGQGEDGGGGGESGGPSLRFLNCGTLVGQAWALRFMLKTLRGPLTYGALTLCGPDDQRGFHRFFLENPELCALDYRGALFQTLHFLTSPLHVDGLGQVLVGSLEELKEEKEERRDQSGSSVTGSSGGGDDAGMSWRQRPCAIHGNGGDGKPAFNRLLKGWSQALATTTTTTTHQQGGGSKATTTHSTTTSSAAAAAAAAVSSSSVRVRVEPPPFSAGIALYMEGNLVGAEAAFREAAGLMGHLTTSHSGSDSNALRSDEPSVEPAMVLDATFNLGVVLGELGRLNEAAEAYAATLKLEPNHQGALLNLAALWYSEHTARAELYQQEQRQQQQQQGQGRQHQRQQQNGVIVQGDNSLLDTALELVERALANNPASDDAKGLREKIAAAMASSR